MKGPVTQEWVHGIPFMQQTVLLTAIRGPDGVAKYHPVKYLLRWLRRCTLVSAMGGRVLTNPFEEGGGSFTGPSFDPARHGQYMHRGKIGANSFMYQLVSEYLRSVDELPHHFQMHFMHAVEILGYKHPDPSALEFWNETYIRLVHDFHLWPETEEQLDKRLGDNVDGWLARADEATAS